MKSFSRRGCQVPWYHFSDINLPICDDPTTLAKTIRQNETNYDFERPIKTSIGLAKESGCPLPCTWSTYM